MAYTNVFGYGGDDPATYTAGGYQPPTAAATGTMQDKSAADWIDTARFIYGVYNDRNPPKPKFEATPLSPEQKQLHELYLKSLMDPTTKNNTAIVNDLVTQQLQGLSGMKWQSPRTFGGDVGYGGSNLSYTMPTGANPLFGGGKTPPTQPDGRPWTPQTIPNLSPEQRLDAQRFAQGEGKRLHFAANPGYGGSGMDNIQLGTTGQSRGQFTNSGDDFTNSWTSQLADAGALDPWTEHERHPWAGGRTATGNPINTWAIVDELKQYADTSVTPDGQPDRTGFWGWLTSKIGGAVPQDEEGRERWATRGISLAVAALGIPVPATLLDKGWDGLQYIYRRFINPQPVQPVAPSPAGGV